MSAYLCCDVLHLRVSLTRGRIRLAAPCFRSFLFSLMERFHYCFNWHVDLLWLLGKFSKDVTISLWVGRSLSSHLILLHLTTPVCLLSAAFQTPPSTVPSSLSLTHFVWFITIVSDRFFYPSVSHQHRVKNVCWIKITSQKLISIALTLNRAQQAPVIN